jgi:hypothetical protein
VTSRYIRERQKPEAEHRKGFGSDVEALWKRPASGSALATARQRP